MKHYRSALRRDKIANEGVVISIVLCTLILQTIKDGPHATGEDCKFRTLHSHSDAV